MRFLQERKIDRTGWSEGPWTSEPDELLWKTEAGLAGRILRNEFGTLCGYVGVPKNHPLYGKGYQDRLLYGVDVHGGLTFADVFEVDDAGYWWFGFDCGHAFDLSPGMMAMVEGLRGRIESLFSSFPSMEIYRSIDYVRAQVEFLSSQLVGLRDVKLHKKNRVHKKRLVRVIDEVEKRQRRVLVLPRGNTNNRNGT